MKSEKDLLSIIIPVYNCEEYIENCINTLLNQTYKNSEYIFINDGSTDNTEKILRRYSLKESSIKVYNQNNQGPMAARLLGVQHAKGKYITFVDADDWIKPDMYSIMLKEMVKKQVDLVICNLVELDIKKNIKSEIKINLKSNQVLLKENCNDLIINIFMTSDSLNSMTNKIYKTEIVKKYSHNIFCIFDYGEDLVFNLYYYELLNKLLYINEGFYFYRKGHLSLTSKYRNDNFERTGLNPYLTRKKFAKTYNLTGNQGENLLCLAAIYSLINIYRFEKQNVNNKINIICKNKELIKSIKKVNISVFNNKDKIMFFCLKYNFTYIFKLFSKYLNIRDYIKERKYEKNLFCN